MANAIESVLAGSAGFIASVSPEVKSRVGGAPRVASDPRQAFTFCAERGGLLVLEYAGPDWLPIVRDLRSLCGGDIAMVVAVAPERAAEVSGLQHAGADEVVVWEGRPQNVTWAVERVLAGRAAPAWPAPAARTDVFEARAEAPPVLQRAGPGGAPAPSPAPASPAAFTIREAAPAGAPPGTAPSAWPSGVIAGAEAERLLALAVAGETPGEGPAAAAAVRLAGLLGAAESGALAGAPAPLDGGLLRRLAALRLRLALALETAPAAGAPLDLAAVQSLLGEADGGLQELKSAAEAAGPEVQPAAEEVRNALVKEAIDLTDAVHRIAPSAAAAAPLLPAVRGPLTRVLSNRSGEEAAAPARLRVGWLVALGLATAAAAAFHGHRILTRQPPAPPPRVAGAPAGMVGVREQGMSLVVRQPGQHLDPRQLEAYRAQEQARGQFVLEVGPGVLLSAPEAAREERKP